MPDVKELYGSNCFSNNVMQEKLPENVYREILAIQEGERELSLDIAEEVARAMKEWAIEKGASHYTHLFLPLTGLTAEKHDSFISPVKDGTVIMEFSGRQLIKGESDASSLPSGGLRATFEARGYTAWDPTSPAFLKSDPTGTTLCIPTAFISYYGHALDKKVPLLKSEEALSKQVIRVLRALGNKSSRRVKVYLGLEQEYFLIDKEYFNKRPDLILSGRTVFGVLPAKGQEMEDHYYGAIKERVASFMRELNTELWKVGIPAKTQHNESAPNQFEIAPVYTNSSAAVDANQFIMETIHNVAGRHGMESLLHEKPFAGINGSGKHNNWSIETNDGIKLLDPGENPGTNQSFLLFACAVVEAVDRYASLIRSSAACSGNDHRLGMSEAPPSIVSIYFGAPLTEIFEKIAGGTLQAFSKTSSKSKRGEIEIGVTSLPSLPKDMSDRNRTSPFAFTGNKFEFRMVGSSQSAATSASYINTAIAEVLCEYADKLENPDFTGNAGIKDAVYRIIRESYSAHSRVVFNGNSYSEEWKEEAKKRGLPNLQSTPEAIAILCKEENISLFEKHLVFSREELESRCQIYLEKYSKQLNIEAGIAIDIARRQIFPSAAAFAASMARDSISLSQIKASNIVQKKRAQEIADLCTALSKNADSLERLLLKTRSMENIYEQSCSFSDHVRPAMEKLRKSADELEKYIPREVWPLPGYEEMLFKL